MSYAILSSDRFWSACHLQEKTIAHTQQEDADNRAFCHIFYASHVLNKDHHTHGSLIFIEVFKIYKLLNLLKLEKLFFVGSPIVTTLGGSWAVITAVYMVLFGLNFGQNRPFFALQKSNFGFAFENERTVR